MAGLLLEHKARRGEHWETNLAATQRKDLERKLDRAAFLRGPSITGIILKGGLGVPKIIIWVDFQGLTRVTIGNQ